jgi:hypothetical protein
MNTLIDVVVLLIAYAGLSGVCPILLHLLSSSPTRGNRDVETTSDLSGLPGINSGGRK